MWGLKFSPRRLWRLLQAGKPRTDVSEKHAVCIFIVEEYIHTLKMQSDCWSETSVPVHTNTWYRISESNTHTIYWWHKFNEVMVFREKQSQTSNKNASPGFTLQFKQNFNIWFSLVNNKHAQFFPSLPLSDKEDLCELPNPVQEIKAESVLLHRHCLCWWKAFKNYVENTDSEQ